MGYKLSAGAVNEIFKKWSEEYTIYAPRLFKNGAHYSDTDLVRYAAVDSIEDIEFDVKSEYSHKEVLLPITETLFYFTEDSVKEADPPEKGAIIFLRSCDIHSIKIPDQIYLKNGVLDYYYDRLRRHVKFILIGCPSPSGTCFCVTMGTNRTNDYDCYISPRDGWVYAENKNGDWTALFDELSEEKTDVSPVFAEEDGVHVSIPDNLSLEVMKSSMWDEYDARCINCGRCIFACPTCTCFSMQDIFYTDNGKVGERRRVWAACMVNGFTDMAGGHRFREKNGQRLRFRVLHKIYDFKKRFGFHMCTGCGRCSDICPEYISYSACINKLGKAMEEVSEHDAK